MRVISGKAKGAKLECLKGEAVRPTLDRVKESLFSQIRPDIPGAWILDLFAGSGSIGVEALSEGAAKVVFVEINSKAQTLVYKNLETCRFWDSREGNKDALWTLLKSNALHAVNLLDERGSRFDLVYMDPPFTGDLYEETLLALAEASILKEDGVVVVEHFHKKGLADNYGKLALIKSRKIGHTCLSFYGFQPNCI